MISELYSHGDEATQPHKQSPKPGPRAKLHIAILECEELPEIIVKSHGTFTDVFDEWIQSGMTKTNSKRRLHQQRLIEVSRWSALDGIYPNNLGTIDAFIITGSISSAYDNSTWIRALEEYIRVVYTTQSHIKFFGSCFGHQILAQALLGQYGVKVERSDHGWENGVHEVTLSAQFIAHFPNLRNKTMRYQFVHSDHVVAESLPPGWLSIGSSYKCKVQGLFEPGRVLTYQGHPEFDQKILYYFMDILGGSGILDNETYEASLKLIDQESTSQLAAEVVVRFFESGS